MGTVYRAVRIDGEFEAVVAIKVVRHGRLAAFYDATGREREAAQNWKRAKAVYDELDREGHLEASDVRSDAENVRAEARRHAVK